MTSTITLQVCALFASSLSLFALSSNSCTAIGSGREAVLPSDQKAAGVEVFFMHECFLMHECLEKHSLSDVGGLSII